MIMPELWLIKVFAALASALLAVIGCTVARYIKRSGGASSWEEGMQIGGNTLAAGILLAAGLTHMLPDATEALSGITDYPLAPAIAGSAFCFLVVLGEAVGCCMPKREEPHTQTACAAYGASFALWPRFELMPPHGCETRASPPVSFSAGADVEAEVPAAAAGAAEAAGDAVKPRSWSGGCCAPAPALPAGTGGEDMCGECGSSSTPCQAPQPPPPEAAALPPGHSCHSHSGCCRVHRHADAPCSTQDLGQGRPHGLASPLLNAAGREPGPGHSHGQAHGHAHGHAHGGTSAASASHTGPQEQVPPGSAEAISSCHVRAVGAGAAVEARSFLVFFALSFHSVMEGLGMGSAEHGRLLLTVMLAILAHKGLAAFALGCSLTQSDLPCWKFWTFVTIFAAGTPLGCAAGMLSVQIGNAVAESTASGVCIALASGTFLQVSTMELLPRAFAEERRKLLGCCCLVVGYALMSVLAIWC